MRRRIAVLCLALALALAGTVAVSAPAALAQTGEVTTTTPEVPSMLPRPNSGVAPTEAGDRGGALQTALFVIMCGGVVIIGALVVRESRKARASRGF